MQKLSQEQLTRRATIDAVLGSVIGAGGGAALGRLASAIIALASRGKIKPGIGGTIAGTTSGGLLGGLTGAMVGGGEGQWRQKMQKLSQEQPTRRATGGAVLGSVIGAGGGAALGRLASAIIALASRGKIKPGIGGTIAGTTSGGLLGGLTGAMVGGGEGQYRVLRKKGSVQIQKQAIDIAKIVAALQRVKGMARRAAEGFTTGIDAGFGDMADVAGGKNKLKNILNPNVTARGSDSSRLLRESPVGRAGNYGARVGHTAALTSPITVPAAGINALVASRGEDKNAAYAQGFVNKCAELGIDPKVLIGQ